MRCPFRLLLSALGLLFALTPPAVAGQATAVAVPSATSDPSSTYSLLTDREPLASLAGPWRFQPGDDPRWADPSFDDSQWALIASNGEWADAGFQNLSGLAWYRFRVTLPAGEAPYSLRLPQIPTCYQVFADGRLLLTLGSMPPHALLYRTRPVVVDLPGQLPREEARPSPRTVVIALRIWQYPGWSRYVYGGLHGPAFVGRSDLVHAQFEYYKAAHKWNLSDLFDLGVLDLLAFIIAFALFLSRRSEREYLWFSLLVLGSAGDHLVRGWSDVHLSRINLAEGVMYLFSAQFLAASLLFYRSLLGGKWSIPFKFALLCCGLYYANSLTGRPGLQSVTKENLWEMLWSLPIYAWILLLIYRRAHQHRPDARLLAFPATLLYGALFYHQMVWTLETTGVSFVNHLYIYFQTPFYFTLEDAAEAFFLMTMLAILLNRFARTQRVQDRIASELDAARSVQQLLVPDQSPHLPGLAITAAYHPAQEVGGDFFQILPLASGAVLVVIGDVAGKGLPAALTVSLAVGSLRTLADFTQSPGEILAGLNRRLHGRGSGFTTCLALRFSADRTVLTVANAGHLPPYLNGDELPTEPNLPLGLDPHASFAESTFALHEGNHLTVLTDGVPEAMHGRELFGFGRTQSASRYPAAHIADLARGFGQADDITVLTVDVLPIAATATRHLQPQIEPA